MKQKLEDSFPIIFAASMSIGPLMLHYVFGVSGRNSILIPYGSMVVVYVALVARVLITRKSWQ